MKADHKIIKTKDPSTLNPCQIVSRPSGDCPYFLVCLHEDKINQHGLESDIIEDTVAFFSNYDLDEGEDIEEEMFVD